jgi:hypothetical protein
VKDAKDLIPWTVTDISIRPYDGYWSMNPSIHFDGQIWRCSLRCTDYAMPDGVTIRSKHAGPGHQSKNAMIVLDPNGWRVAETHKMHERDPHPRVSSANVGYEDMRIFRTDRGGLQGIAASLHLARDARPAAGGAHHQPPEQVLLSFDEKYDIVGAQPIRGDWWSGTAQKNWVPFDDCAEPRFLYSIGKGTLFGDRGALRGDESRVVPTSRARSISSNVDPASTERSRAELADRERLEREQQEREQRERADREQQEKEQQEQHEAEKRAKKEKDRERPRDLRVTSRGVQSTLRRGMRLSHDTVTSRPAYVAHSAAGHRGGRVNTESARGTAGGRTLMPKYEGLRGGSQLVRVSDDAWLGIGHEMQFLKGKKYYWHTFYLVNAQGKMKSASEPLKLASNGIEFAAGMAIDGDRMVISFGVDDMECKIGETRLGAVLEILRPL